MGFDIIGDVHGCLLELRALLSRLGYKIHDYRLQPPPGRQLVLVGDLVDRGPEIVGVLKLLMQAVADGTALCVQGNHDVRLMHVLGGAVPPPSTSLAASLRQLDTAPASFREQVHGFFQRLPSRLELDQGRLLVVHAGEFTTDDPELQAQFNIHGALTGRRDASGVRERVDWVRSYDGQAWVVYGHTTVLKAVWQGRTLNLDTGCVYGGHLTALRYPEQEVVSVPAARAYASSSRWAALIRSRELLESAPRLLPRPS